MAMAKLKNLLEDDSVKAAENARAEGYATPLTEMTIKAAYAEILFCGRLSRRTGKLVTEIAYTEACAVAQAKRDVSAGYDAAHWRSAPGSGSYAPGCAVRSEIQRLREMLLRNGIDPDTGQPLPNFNNGNDADNKRPEK